MVDGMMATMSSTPVPWFQARLWAKTPWCINILEISICFPISALLQPSVPTLCLCQIYFFGDMMTHQRGQCVFLKCIVLGIQHRARSKIHVHCRPGGSWSLARWLMVLEGRACAQFFVSITLFHLLTVPAIFKKHASRPHDTKSISHLSVWLTGVWCIQAEMQGSFWNLLIL